jgi:ribosomal protein S8
MAVKDLSEIHHLVSDLFRWPDTVEKWDQYKLSSEQVDFFRKNGFVSGIKLLDEKQIEKIRVELSEIADPGHPGHHLFYEFHSNESTDH